MNNGKHYNNIGRQQVCSFVVMSGAVLKIGNNVGMSASTIVCKNKIIIEDYVKLGGNVVIYDTDFHSLDPEVRKDRDKDLQNANDAPVIICKNAFIGAHSTILKGVTIGKNSIVGACSVVTKSIPANQVWAGNPARFIREI